MGGAGNRAIVCHSERDFWGVLGLVEQGIGIVQ